MEQMKSAAKRELYGVVYSIREQDYVKEVSQAPKDTYVVVHLYASTESDCAILNKYLDVVATKFRSVKFCKIKAQEAIHNYPNHKCPTILIYYNTHIIKQIEKLDYFGGQRTSSQSIEYMLGQPFTVKPTGEEEQTHTVLKTDLKQNPLSQANKLNLQNKKGKRQADDSDDDDEDD